MSITGKNLIAGQESARGAKTFAATNPTTGAELPTRFTEATAEEVDEALRAAEGAFAAYRRKSGREIAGFLDAVAREIEALGDALLERAHAETGLPLARLQGERGRTLGQVRAYAEIAREGAWVAARIDRGNPDRKPLPKPDVRTMNVALGPVVVFGASNFPLAISVAGIDTVSALAVGCPVVVKGHPAHPGTSELVARAFARAAAATGMPAGVFSLLQGGSHELGLGLVEHPATKAVAFTGSFRGGKALFDAGVRRPEPIPVYAEMGSTNPVLVLPGALAERGAQIAAAYVQSVTLGVGQFCTNPGLVAGLAGPGLDGFIAAAGEAAQAIAPATMLHAGIREAFDAGIARVAATPGVSVVGKSAAAPASGRTEAPCVLFAADVGVLDANPHLAEEVFGPTSTTIRCRDESELLALVRGLGGHLVASVHATAEDLAEFADVLALLETKVGRIVYNGFGTGIEVCAAMHHSGPYPATTDPHHTSIGHAALFRFCRPLCLQGCPPAALPEALRDENPLGLPRLVDGRLTRDAL
jgi:NADP-dependent aldehyde dehydrogenase